MNTFLNLCSSFDRALTLSLKWICIALFAAITLILTLNIVMRFLPLMSMHWFDEILELLYAALVFYGAAAVWVTHSHFRVGDWISQHIASMKLRFIYRLLVELCSVAFIAIFFKYALDLTMRTEEQTTAFAMSKKWLYVCMPISGGIMLLYSLKNLYLELTGIVRPELAMQLPQENLDH